MKSTIAIDESLIQTEMKYWKVPGLSVSIVKEGALPYAKGFGVRNDTSQPVDAHTQFCIASCSKAMTSAIIAMLVSQGKLSYDTPIRKYLPAFTLVDAKASEKVTLRDLLCHRSGLGGHDGIWPVKENLSQFTSRFKFLQPSAPYGTKAQYSNIMYGLAGHVAEVVTGKDWNSLVHEYLFAPLSMSESSCQAAQLISASNHADPYQVINGKLTALPVWNVDTVAPAASVNTTAQDMCSWLQFLINQGKTQDGRNLICEDVFQQMITKQMDFQDAISSGECYPSDGYAMGWQTGSYRGCEIIKHTGKIEGYSAIQVILPQHKLGVAICLNLHSPTISIMYTILYSIIDKLLLLDPIPWQNIFHTETPPTAEDYDDCRENIFAQRYPAAVPNQIIPQKDLQKYTGKYYADGYGYAEILIKENTLYLFYRDGLCEIIPYWGGVFKVSQLKEDILTLDLPLSFLQKEGVVIGFHVPFEPMTADIAFWRIENRVL